MTPAFYHRVVSILFVAASSLVGTVEDATACVPPPSVQIDSVTPAGTLSPGDVVQIHGSGFSQLRPEALLYFAARFGAPGFGGDTSPIWPDSDTLVYAHVPNEAESGSIAIRQWVMYDASCPSSGVATIPGSSVGVLTDVGLGPDVKIDNKRPAGPIVEATAISGSQVTLRWTVPNIPSAPPVDGFVVRVSDDFGVNWTLVRTFSTPTVGELTVSGLRPATQYAFEVASHAATGESWTLPNDWGWATTFGNTGGTAQVFVTYNGNGTLLCAASPTVTNAEAYFDQPAANGLRNGIVDGANGAPNDGSFPAFVYFAQNPNNPFAKPLRRLAASASYGRTVAGQLAGNLVITAYICTGATPQFVSLHLGVSQPAGSQPIVEFVRMDAGDRLVYVPERRDTGVVMSGYIHHDTDAIDVAALLGAQPRAIGHSSSTLTFIDVGTQQTWSANVEFRYDVPILAR